MDRLYHQHRTESQGESERFSRQGSQEVFWQRYRISEKPGSSSENTRLSPMPPDDSCSPPHPGTRRARSRSPHDRSLGGNQEPTAQELLQKLATETPENPLLFLNRLLPYWENAIHNGKFGKTEAEIRTAFQKLGVIRASGTKEKLFSLYHACQYATGSGHKRENTAKLAFHYARNYLEPNKKYQQACHLLEEQIVSLSCSSSSHLNDKKALKKYIQTAFHHCQTQLFASKTADEWQQEIHQDYLRACLPGQYQKLLLKIESFRAHFEKQLSPSANDRMLITHLQCLVFLQKNASDEQLPGITRRLLSASSNIIPHPDTGHEVIAQLIEAGLYYKVLTMIQDILDHYQGQPSLSANARKKYLMSKATVLCLLNGPSGAYLDELGITLAQLIGRKRIREIFPAATFICPASLAPFPCLPDRQTSEHGEFIRQLADIAGEQKNYALAWSLYLYAVGEMDEQRDFFPEQCLHAFDDVLTRAVQVAVNLFERQCSGESRHNSLDSHPHFKRVYRFICYLGKRDAADSTLLEQYTRRLLQLVKTPAPREHDLFINKMKAEGLLKPCAPAILKT